MYSLKLFIHNIPNEIKIGLLIIISGFILYFIFKYYLKKLLNKGQIFVKEIDIPFELLFGPVRFLMPNLGLLILLPFLSISTRIRALLNHVLVIWFIIGLAWLLIRTFVIAKGVIMSRYKLDAKDNLKARQINTQISVIQRVIGAIIFIIAASAILMTFDKVRQIGVSVLASAGIAGIIIGFAAQKSIATLIAGIQIALTQPIRIDDVVIVENEWGWIEEITLTYVVVRIWDQRRLVVPITYFIEQPFQNWTRKTAELLGTIFLYADYSVPIDELRKELERIVSETSLYDGRVAKIQVTNANDKTIELRALVSAENSSNAWELRCLVREKLIDYMQKNHPDKLPQFRVELQKQV